MNILERIDGLEAKFHEVSLLITDPSVIADQARYVRLNRLSPSCSSLLIPGVLQRVPGGGEPAEGCEAEGEGDAQITERRL